MTHENGATSVSAADIAEIRDLFLRQAAGETAHDIEAIEAVLAGTWRFEPDAGEIRITALTPDVAHIYAPTRITAGAAGQEPATVSFLVNEFAIRTPEGWRISAIVPVPAQ
jgi:hypothetical protein